MAWRVSKQSLIDVEISSLGVIERASFSPGPGFTVITGETGAGKTMVLSALSLLTGSRADATVVRTGSDRANIVGRFAISEESGEKVREIGGEVEGGELLLSRTITHDGKSRASIGGTSTTVTNLSEIGSELLSIHGQSANFTLLKPNRAREILDGYGTTDISKLLLEYQRMYAEYRELIQTINELEKLESTRERELERISHFLEEFDRIKPSPRESELLRERILNLENLDSTRGSLADSLNALTENELSISAQLSAVKRALDSLGDESASVRDSNALVREISILVNELSSQLRRQEELLDVEPGALEDMHSRRAQVQGLIKKFGDLKADDPEQALIDEAKRARILYSQLHGGDQGIAALLDRKSELVVQLVGASRRLTRARQEVGEKLGSEISGELVELAMPGARIHVEVAPLVDGFVLNDASGSVMCGPSGSDEVAFLLTPHPGAMPLPINKGASGGELSRIMLAIEVVLAGRSSIPTYVFDEVDAGVGGKAAVEVGRRLAKLARHAQVLVVTHLPQVAAWADTHYSIAKNSSEKVTSSDLHLLLGAERTSELARMMAGREESQLAREHAQELLDFVAKERTRTVANRGQRA